MKNYHIIEVKYHGATNTSGSRVSLYSGRFKTRKTIPYDYSLSHPVDMAEQYLLENGFEIVGSGEGMRTGRAVDFIVTNTFKSL